MNVGLVVEGPTDEAVYRILLQRIRNNLGALQVRPCGGKSKLKHSFVGHLKEFQRNAAWQINAAFILRDSDCHTPLKIEQQLRDVLSASGFTPNFPVEFFATPCMLESWLVSDIGAIRTVAGGRGANSEAHLEHLLITPQQSANDDDAFNRVLIEMGLPRTPAVYAEIASGMDFTLVKQRCGYFREFCRRVALH